MCVYIHVWMPKADVKEISSIALTPYSFRQGLSIKSITGIAGITCQLALGIPFLLPLRLESQAYCHSHEAFGGFWGSECWSSCQHSKSCNSWAISLSQHLHFKQVIYICGVKEISLVLVWRCEQKLCHYGSCGVVQFRSRLCLLWCEYFLLTQFCSHTALLFTFREAAEGE